MRSSLMMRCCLKDFWSFTGRIPNKTIQERYFCRSWNNFNLFIFVIEFSPHLCYAGYIWSFFYKIFVPLWITFLTRFISLGDHFIPGSCKLIFVCRFYLWRSGTARFMEFLWISIQDIRGSLFCWCLSVFSLSLFFCLDLCLHYCFCFLRSSLLISRTIFI